MKTVMVKHNPTKCENIYQNVFVMHVKKVDSREDYNFYRCVDEKKSIVGIKESVRESKLHLLTGNREKFNSRYYNFIEWINDKHIDIYSKCVGNRFKIISKGSNHTENIIYSTKLENTEQIPQRFETFQYIDKINTSILVNSNVSGIYYNIMDKKDIISDNWELKFKIDKQNDFGKVKIKSIY